MLTSNIFGNSCSKNSGNYLVKITSKHSNQLCIAFNQDSRSVLDPGTFAEAFSDVSIVTALLDIACIMWVARSADIAKPENNEYRAVLEKRATGILSLLFKFYKVRNVWHECSLFDTFEVSRFFETSRLKHVETEVETVESLGRYYRNRVDFLNLSSIPFLLSIVSGLSIPYIYYLWIDIDLNWCRLSGHTCLVIIDIF